MNSAVKVSASKRLGSGVVTSARLRSVKLERDDPGVGLSVWLAANKPCRGSRGAGARGNISSSTSGMGDMVCSSLPPDKDEADVRLEWPRLLFVSGFNWFEPVRAINSQDGAVCGSSGDANALLPASCCAMDANCGGADVGGMSGEEARVVPDQNEGTSELGDATLGTCSHSLIEMDGMLPPAEKVPRLRSSAVNEAGIVVSRFR